MHVISSGAKVILIKIAQRFPDRKRKNGSAVKTAFRAALLCVILACFLPVSNAIHREAANDWRSGWEEWKCGNAAAALGHWSKNPLTAPFEMRPSRVAYWKIRAFEKLGRTEEAALTASMLALRSPRDFYSLVLAYEGRYPTLTRAARKACARAAYMRRWNGEVARASAETGVSKNILLGLIRQESKFNERAVSRSGAVGLMQLMPFTAREAAARLKKDELSPYEPTHNIMLGAAYFAHLKAKFGQAPAGPRGLQRGRGLRIAVGDGREGLGGMDRGDPLPADARVCALGAGKYRGLQRNGQGGAPRRAVFLFGGAGASPADEEACLRPKTMINNKEGSQMPDEVFNPIDTVRRFLEKNDCASQIMETEATIFTVTDASLAVGAPEEEILKAYPAREPRKELRAGADVRRQPRRYEEDQKLLGASHVSFADGRPARNGRDSAPAACPVGYPEQPPTLLDEDLFRHRTVWAAAGTDHAFFPI
ncbi:MAG: transglycosylase SLT domain-containing protein [Cloacibacillus evryensis]